jgi:hypothetical protein
MVHLVICRCPTAFSKASNNSLDNGESKGTNGSNYIESSEEDQTGGNTIINIENIEKINIVKGMVVSAETKLTYFNCC